MRHRTNRTTWRERPRLVVLLATLLLLGGSACAWHGDDGTSDDSSQTDSAEGGGGEGDGRGDDEDGNGKAGQPSPIRVPQALDREGSIFQGVAAEDAVEGLARSTGLAGLRPGASTSGWPSPWR